MDSNVAELEKAINQEPSASPQREPEGQGTTSRWADPKFRRAALGALVVLAVVTVALILYYRNRVGTDDAQVDGHIIPIAAKIYGDISEVQVLDNQAVKAGQVLVRIDPRDYQARADQAKAALALAENQAKAAEVGVPMTQETTQSYTSSADAQLASAQAEYDRTKSAYQKDSTAELEFARANVDARQADSDRAQADLARMKPLVEKAEISELQFDAYRAAARVSESTLAAAKDQLAAAERSAEISKDAMLGAKAKVDIARAGIQQARANNRQVPIKQADAAAAVAAVAQAKANLEAAELQLSYATVVAPMDSVVTKKSVEVGQIVQPGQSLMVLIPLQDVWVTANFKETQLEKVRPGQKAEIHVDMYGETFTGHVDSIAGATGAKLSLLPPENATGNFVKVVERIPVKILVDPVPPDKAILRPGMNVDATIITK
jgi:membrane fusion protein (multidrug efflux system)